MIWNVQRAQEEKNGFSQASDRVLVVVTTCVCVCGFQDDILTCIEFVVFGLYLIQGICELESQIR